VRFAAALVAAGCAMGAASDVASAQDSIPASLTGGKGDPARGRAIVTNRQLGLCLLCHSGPFPEERFQGELAPGPARRRRALDGGPAAAADRGLRPHTIPPRSCRRIIEPRASPGWTPCSAAKPILSAEQVEDVVAF
jgi:sulfur-oxidizing protein SoxX